MKRLVVILALIVLPMANIAPSALATKPARGCSDHFLKSGDRALVKFLHEQFPDFPLDSIKQIVAKTDKNADDQVCYKQLGSGYYDLVDNTANQ